jgi:hypothetical protein
MKGKLYRLIRMTLEVTKNRVKVVDRISDKFKIEEGLRQVSHTLYLCARVHQCLAFADDLAILTRS